MFGLLRTIITYALPPRCNGCATIVDDDRRFCFKCWSDLDFLTGCGCALCNIPIGAASGSICGECIADPPRHDGVRAAVVYGPIASAVALRLKYGRKTGLAWTMAALMTNHVDKGGILVPVPLHRWRLWSRGFNQAQLIGDAIAKSVGLVCDRDLLVRKRATNSLRGLSGAKRADAVRGAFRTTRKLQGETIWLVDDVYTSGATANACAATLKRGGAGEVVVLAWARVLRDEPRH